MDMKELIACDSRRGKAGMLAILFLCSMIFALAFEGVCYAFLGPISTGSWINVYRWGFVTACALVLSGFFVFRKDALRSPEKLFFCIVLATTCYSSLAMDVNETSWDVGAHFEFMLDWAAPDMSNELTVAEVEMKGPQSYLTSISELQNWKDDLNAKDDVDAGVTLEPSLAKLYQHIGSLPGSLVYLVLSFLGVPFSIKFVLTRLTYALIYSFVTYFGMKKLRSGKMLFAVVALLPTAVFLAANYSYDYWLNAFALYAVASLVGILQRPDERVNLKQIIMLFVAFVAALGPKPIYFPLVLLCFLVPKSRFATKRGSRWFRVATVAVSLFVAASFLVPYFFVTGPGIGDTRGGSGVNSSEQIALILSDPLGYIQVLLSFLAWYLSIPASSGYVCMYAYIGYPSSIVWMLVLGALFFTAITDKSQADRQVNTWRSRVLAITVFCACVVLVASALYVSYNPVGATWVEGCQPRYLIPLLFALLVFLSGPKLGWPRSERGRSMYNFGVLGIMAWANMFGFWQVYVSLLH